ncbi:MAG TPA: hypothetical protein VK139_06595, partial [Microbacteriaceae bacterium]|nr:hypothetical protein [Microbacteriaceae bacterium]
MSIEFTAPPASRRERREREQLLISQGYSPEQAALIAEGSGAVTESASEPTPAVSPEVLHGSVDEPRPEAASTIPHADSAVAPAPGVPAVFGILPSRRELRERAAGAQAGGVVPGTGTPVITPST